MIALEKALKRLATKLTGKPAQEMPGNLEGIVKYMADNYEPANGAIGEPGPQGEKGDPGEPGATGEKGAAGKDGVGVVGIALTVDENGKVTGGSWTDTAKKEHTITIE